jgi:hypothetical protein
MGVRECPQRVEVSPTFVGFTSSSLKNGLEQNFEIRTKPVMKTAILLQRHSCLHVCRQISVPLEQRWDEEGKLSAVAKI